MNILTLIKQHPLLFSDLRTLGIPHTTLNDIALRISAQLGGNPRYNLCYVMAALNGREFVRTIDTQELAESSGISPALAQSIVLLIAPWVDRFQLNAN